MARRFFPTERDGLVHLGQYAAFMWTDTFIAPNGKSTSETAEYDGTACGLSVPVGTLEKVHGIVNCVACLSRQREGDTLERIVDVVPS